jgi:twitching motility protein PilT
MDLEQVLRTAIDAGASDIHLVVGHPPMVRIHTVMTPMADFGLVTPEDALAMFKHMANEQQLALFDKIKDADFSYDVPDLCRFRVNVHMQRRSVAISMRSIKVNAPPLESLNLPEVIARLTYLPRGLVLVTGDTGSGKSTTLAAMIQAMNQRYSKHVITL